MKTLISSFWLAPCFALLFSLNSTGQTNWTDLTSGELLLETTAVPPGDPFEVGFLIKLKPGWHTYWKNSGDSGAAPRFDWHDQAAQISGPIYPVPQKFDEAGIVTFGFSDEVLLVFKHSGLSQSQTLKVTAEWLVCKDICLPAMAEFSIPITVAPVEQIEASRSRAAFEKARRQWPLPGVVDVKILKGEEGARAQYRMKLDEPPKSFEFFPHQNLPFEEIAVKQFEFNEGILSWSLPLKKSSTGANALMGIARIEIESKRLLLDLTSGDASFGLIPLSILWAFLSAFLGGLILNLMPCVFPILSMKLFSVLKISAKDYSRVRKDQLAYVAGVLFTFTALGITLSLVRQAGVQVGWGFQLQSPLFVGSLIILFVILALEMFGFFNFDLIDPSKGNSLTRKEGLWGSFFTGVLAVVVASPCSAPFMGAAVGAALAQPNWVLGPLIFMTLGIGLSFPYLLLALSPKLLRWVPRPGLWMKYVKEAMAFPLLLTALWLLWIFDQVALSSDLVVLGLILIGFVFALWVGRFKRWLAWIFAALTLVLWVCHFAFQKERSFETTQDQSTSWISFNEEVLKERQPGEVMFVNMTADWCITCKVNEKLIFENKEIKEFMAGEKIVQVKGDWTRRDPKITQFLDRFNRAGVPFYVIFSDLRPQGEALSEVMTKDSFKQKLNEHASFSKGSK